MVVLVGVRLVALAVVAGLGLQLRLAVELLLLAAAAELLLEVLLGLLLVFLSTIRPERGNRRVTVRKPIFSSRGG